MSSDHPQAYQSTWSPECAQMPSRSGVFGRSVLIILALLVYWLVTAQPILADQKHELIPAAPKVAWHYGADPPLETLKVFDIIVVEPGHRLDPAAHRSKTAGRSDLFAYVSAGELDPGRSYEGLMPADMLVGRNETWNSQIIDQSHPDWPAFFVDHIIGPLWQEGYRGFFLDTMDSYHLIAKTPARRAALRQGLLNAISLMRQRYPGSKLITNRGFELLDDIHRQFQDDLLAVAAESLFGRWDHGNKRYVTVPTADREWLVGQFRKAQNNGIPAISIDYVAPGDRENARRIASDILNLGIMPFVTNGEISQIGIGSIEIKPRKVLMVHSGSSPDGDEHYSIAQRIAKMPLHYLGYRVDLIDVRFKALPQGVLAGEYAAIVGVFEDEVPEKTAELRRFYQRAYQQKVPMVFLNGFGIDAETELLDRPALLQPSPSLGWPVTAISHDSKIANYIMTYLP